MTIMTEHFEMPPIPDKQYFTIGEVTQIVQLPPYVLRYWESQFRLLKPARRTSGQRIYMRRDIERIFQVKDLLHSKKFTIAGAKKHLMGDRRKKDEFDLFSSSLEGNAPAIAALKEVRAELEDILNTLKTGEK
jgi:DNA-binding transcriptional MerR regulator